MRKLADDSKLSRSDLENGTISISNIGAVGVGTYAGPLILPPQVCIVAIGSTKVLPRYENENYDKVVPKKIVNILNNVDAIEFCLRPSSHRRRNYR